MYKCLPSFKNTRCATRIHNKVSETFSDRKFYLKHKLSTASLQSSTVCRRLQTGSRKLVLQIKFTIRERFRNFVYLVVSIFCLLCFQLDSGSSLSHYAFQKSLH